MRLLPFKLAPPALFLLLLCAPAAECQSVIVVDSVDVLFSLILTGANLTNLDISGVNQTQIVDRLNSLAASDPDTYAPLKDAFVKSVSEALGSNSVTVNECAVGSYVDASNGACTPCPAGFYSETARANSISFCLPCEAGTFSNATGAGARATCRPCPSGTFSNVAAATSRSVCGGCGLNMVSNAGARLASDCVCAGGFYMVGGNGTSLGTCVRCEPGFFCSSGARNACPQSQLAPPRSTSQPGAVSREDCYCLPGYYGVAAAITGCSFCDQGYYCTGKLVTDEFVKNQAQIYQCPASSSSPAGSTNLDQCTCQGNYRKQPSSPATRALGVTATQCNCTVQYQCASGSCSSCAAESPCATGQTLTCPQGYLHHAGTSTTWNSPGFPGSGTWFIAPPGAQRVFLRVHSINTGNVVNRLSVYACETAACGSALQLDTPQTSVNGNPQNDRVFSTPPGYGVVMLVWVAQQSVAVETPFRVEYASLRACDSGANVSVSLGPAVYIATSETVNPTQLALSWPLMAWLGDTLTFPEYPAQSQVPVAVFDSAGQVVKELGFTQWSPGATGSYLVVDLSMPSRHRQLRVLPAGARTVTAYYANGVGATGFTLSGDVTGAGSPDVVLVVGDTLVFSRLLSTGGGVMLLSSYNATSGAFALLDGGDVVGQSTASVAQPSLTWRTAGRDPGTYLYASATSTGSVRVGRVLLYERPGGAQCIVCQAGEYCFDGSAVQCPPNSVSLQGSTSVSACQCAAGFAVSTTDMVSYQNGQAVDSGGRHSCAIGSDGSLWCWGANEAGQLGLGFAGEAERAPRRVPGLSDVRNVSLGDNFTCAVVGSGLMVKCWGGNYWGQLGMDAVDEYLASPPADGWSLLAGATVADGASTANAYATRALSCGDQSCCAIITRSSGSDALTCWGRGSGGQLGEGENSLRRRPIGAGTDPASVPADRRGYAAMGAVVLGFGSEKAVLVTMGGDHACAVMESGAVWCWGSNANGAVGRGGGQQFYNPTAVSLGGPAKTVNCYNLVCCAVMRDTFGVKCWGRGADGRLGTGLLDVGVTAASMGSNLQQVQLGTGLFAIDVNVGRSQTCALLSNNGVKCWGLVGSVVVGDNPPIEMSDLLPSVALLGTQVVLQMSGKGLTTCAVMSDYQVACWGDNDFGQLGSAPAAGVARNMTLVAFAPSESGAWTALASSGTPQTLACVGCQANTFCLGGTAPPQACPANTMSGLRTMRRQDCRCVPGTKLVSGNCVLCTGAEYCLNGAALSCGSFSSTTFDGASSSAACACARGYFFSAVTRQCSACGVGLFKDAVGNAGNCTPCPAGTRSSVTALGNASGCAECGPGSFSSAGSSACTPCATGTAAPPRSRSCSACGPGFFSDGTDAACRPCPAGTYDEEPRNGEPGTCTDCGPGQFSTALNATSRATCRTCPAGNVSDGGSSGCRPCGVGEYSAAGTQSCLACPGNSTSAAGSAYGQCRCLAGFFKRLESDGVTFVCVPCGPGEFAGFDRSGSCERCPGGTASAAAVATSSAVCTECPAGSFAPPGSGACLPCAAWSFSAARGASACTNCSLGYHAAPGSTQCSACPPGRFSLVPISSSSGCRLCEAGKFCVGGIEASKPGGRQVEDCPLGTYKLDTGMSLSSQCTACPERSFCPNPTTIGSCPFGTTSNLSSTSQLQCTCMVGFSCRYQRVVNAVVTLLMSLQDWNANSAVRTAFVNAVAQSARTSPANVRIDSVTAGRSSVPGGGARRLFGFAESAAVSARRGAEAAVSGESAAVVARRGAEAAVSGESAAVVARRGAEAAGETHLALEILEGHGSGLDAELDRELVRAGLGSSAGKVWIEPHSVEVSPVKW